MIYIASPYSTPLAEPMATQVRIKRFGEATKFTGFIIQQGVAAFSPIAYFHPYAMGLNLPTDAAFWDEINMSFLRHAEALFCLHLPGWDQSKGVQHELKFAKVARIPIVHWKEVQGGYEPLDGQSSIEIIKEKQK